MTELVYLKNDEAVCSSLQVAEKFGKRHDRVLRAIDNLLETLPKNGEVSKMFILSKRKAADGQFHRMYFMNRDGFSLLVMGFTGKKALEWKLKYIKAFNQMEKFILERQTQAWIDSRKAGKLTRKAETDTIKKLVEYAQAQIKLLLNCCDERDKEICKLVDEILGNHRKYYDMVHNMRIDARGYFIENDEAEKIKESIENEIVDLVKKLHIYLKAEWSRVKYESQGKIYEKETQEFDICELEQKYDDSSYKSNIWERFWINIKAKSKRICSSPKFIILCFGVILVGIVA